MNSSNANNATQITVSHHGENGTGNKRMSSHLRHPTTFGEAGVDRPFLVRLEAARLP
jgi:hypothetical protein